MRLAKVYVGDTLCGTLPSEGLRSSAKYEVICNESGLPVCEEGAPAEPECQEIAALVPRAIEGGSVKIMNDADQ